MIDDERLTKEIVDLNFRFGAEVDASVARVQEEASEEEFQRYRRAAGQVMGAMLIDVLNPVLSRHRALAPPGFHLPPERKA